LAEVDAAVQEGCVGIDVRVTGEANVESVALIDGEGGVENVALIGDIKGVDK